MYICVRYTNLNIYSYSIRFCIATFGIQPSALICKGLLDHCKNHLVVFRLGVVYFAHYGFRSFPQFYRINLLLPSASDQVIKSSFLHLIIAIDADGRGSGGSKG